MQRLTYWVIAAISMLAVNLVLLAWIIVPLEWDLESEWFPVSVNSKNEATDQRSYVPSFLDGVGDQKSYVPSFLGDSSDSVDDLHKENERLKREMQCLEEKARDPSRWCWRR